MAQVEVLEEHYQDVNPLDFRSHPKGQRLYWANKRWRSERKGWGQLRPVRTTDSDYEAIKSHLVEAPLDIDVHGDNLVHRGDLVLCVKSEEEATKRQRRNYMKATRLTRELKAGRNLVQEEISQVKGGGELAAMTPAFLHEKKK